MGNIKYIVTRINGTEAIILFPSFVPHDKLHIDKRTIVSAGFVEMIYAIDYHDEVIAKPRCYGESEALKIKSRPEDSILAELMFRKGG